MTDAKARLVVVTGWTGAGKSTIADALALHVGATVASFDWIMSGLRAFPDLWALIEIPVEQQREIGWSLLSRVAEQQLRRGAACILDLVAREAPRTYWEGLAGRYQAPFHVIECICSDLEVHRSRLIDRQRDIPRWYELIWDDALRGRDRYVRLAEPKLVLDAVNDLASNIAKAKAYLSTDPAMEA